MQNNYNMLNIIRLFLPKGALLGRTTVCKHTVGSGGETELPYGNRTMKDGPLDLTLNLHLREEF